jgi:hypothetical protein
MELNNAHRERQIAPQRFLAFGLISALAHLLLFAVVFFWMGWRPSTIFIAAGPGEGGEGGGAGAIQVGVVDGSQILGFARKQTAGYIGDDDKDTVNTERLVHAAQPEEADEPLPDSKKKIDPEARATDLPVPTREEKLWSAKVRRAASRETSASVSSSYGSPKPAIQGGIGIGQGDGSGLGTGLPGGSEYGRRIQNILSRNFTPPSLSVNGVSNVVVYVKISRDGRVTSVVGGRVPKNFFKQSSPYEQLNYAAERAIIATAAQGLPPFPAGFLSGIQEAVAEVWFQYP